LVISNSAKSGVPIKFSTMILIGKFKMNATMTPKIPDASPMSNVSALKILEISFLRAPKLRMMPISLVLSTTETYVMMPIMTDDTTSEIPANAVKMMVMVLINEEIVDEIASAKSV